MSLFDCHFEGSKWGGGKVWHCATFSSTVIDNHEVLAHSCHPSCTIQITSPELVKHHVTKSPVSGLLTSHATLTLPVRQKHFR